GQGDIDYGQYDDEIEVFGGSGALTMFRISSLDDIAFVNEDGRKEYFDELMFMYKEDVDIAYRLQIANYKCMYTSKAVVYHDRSIFGKGEGLIDIVKGRFAKPKINKEWSWLNHHIILQKMLDNNTYDIRMKTFWHEMKSMVYIVFFEPYLIKQVWELFKLKDKINKRKGQIKKRVEVKSHFEKLMTH
ncbi:MAG: hypothetical protein NT091_02495, partial [Candidatus Falkowbacteria bacterium]|nr:hypothetical protein [Candidatus Falkowbacteria bacterium]